MKVLVIGGGLIGLTTAYFLSRHGHDVMVIDRKCGPALDSSCTNVALPTASVAEP